MAPGERPSARLATRAGRGGIRARIGHRRRSHGDFSALHLTGEVPQHQARLGISVHHDSAARRHESPAGRPVDPVQGLAQRSVANPMVMRGEHEWDLRLLRRQPSQRCVVVVHPHDVEAARPRCRTGGRRRRNVEDSAAWQVVASTVYPSCTSRGRSPAPRGTCVTTVTSAPFAARAAAAWAV